MGRGHGRGLRRIVIKGNGSWAELKERGCMSGQAAIATKAHSGTA